MMKGFKQKLGELIFRRLWVQWRDGIAAAVVTGSGGYVMIGDSITHNGRWDLLFPDLPMRNFGINGERSEHLLQRLDPVIALRPTKLFLLIGTNDLSAAIPIDEIVGNVEQLVDRVHAALPDCRVHIQTVMPRARNFAARVIELNQGYAASAAAKGMPLIDLYTLLDDGSGKIRSDVTNDDLHLTGAGYSIWRKALEPYLRD